MSQPQFEHLRVYGNEYLKLIEYILSSDQTVNTLKILFSLQCISNHSHLEQALSYNLV